MMRMRSWISLISVRGTHISILNAVGSWNQGARLSQQRTQSFKALLPLTLCIAAVQSTNSCIFRFEVSLESGLDAFVVVDGLPEVDKDTKPKLIKFLKRKLDAVGKVKEDSIYMPLGEDGRSER